MVVSSFIFAILFGVIFCHDLESTEMNRVEITPFFDTIIYSDIADIINEFENNGIPQFYDFTNSGSQSDESVEDLLTEYQHYLDKAHKQREKFAEKSKLKNKVPLLRHDQYSKQKPGASSKYDNYYYRNRFFNPGSFNVPKSPFENSLDILFPINTDIKFLDSQNRTAYPSRRNGNTLFPLENRIFNQIKVLDFQSVPHDQFNPLKSECYCKSGRLPCECNCKQCLITNDELAPDHIKQMNMYFPDKKDTIWPLGSMVNNDVPTDNTLNIRIKLDLQLPKVEELGKLYKFSNQAVERENAISKEFSTAINLPFPYLNFPIPMDIFDFKKSSKANKAEWAPIQKSTSHKKKKSRPNSNNKKHRKKFVAFHNIKIESPSIFPMHFNDYIVNDTNNEHNGSNIVMNNTNIKINKNNVLPSANVTVVKNINDSVLPKVQSIDNIIFISNITNNTMNTTEDIPKLENSIENDLLKHDLNVTTKLPSITRKKRNASQKNESSINNVSKNNTSTKTNIAKEKNINKKSDKNVLTDAELLYWPTVNQTRHNTTKNITTYILKTEHKKNKFNMSKEMIRENHTRALEEVVFGDVDWKDMNAIVPALITFVGKYIRGVLTFCSEDICHSINCANKTCLHRTCQSADRFNNKGHCAASSSEDIIASMESITDLPSNIVFEVADILQNKLLGKLFGKATFCINNKCITIVACKKNFVKFRCTNKEINAAGHCNNAKNVKIM